MTCTCSGTYLAPCALCNGTGGEHVVCPECEGEGDVACECPRDDEFTGQQLERTRSLRR